MKKSSKWIVTGVIIVSIIICFVLAAQAVKVYLKGEKMPFNAILISGDNKSVDKAKDSYKDNTKYTKDYKYKIVTEEKEVVEDNGKEVIDDNGKKVKYTNKYLVMTKDTAKSMLEDQIFRERRKGVQGLESDLLKTLPDIEDGKSLVLEEQYYVDKNDEKVEKGKIINIKGKELSLTYGGNWRIGYVPTGDKVIITDDDTYKEIDGEETDMILIRFKKGTKDYRNIKDQKEVEQKLSNIEEIDINYAIIKD